MDYKRRISISDMVFAKEVEGEMVLLDMQSGNYFALDEVGCTLWQIMQDKKSLGEIYDGMLTAYDVDPAHLKCDLLDFMEELENAGLIKMEE